MDPEFGKQFEALTGYQPFPWQTALFSRMAEQPADDAFPPLISVPTGRGKTAVIAVWLLALARRLETGTLSGFPRRLIYVVNRRTVVDQATAVAEHIREALKAEALHDVAKWLRSLSVLEGDIEPVAISTLRGELADNAEWRRDPARCEARRSCRCS